MCILTYFFFYYSCLQFDSCLYMHACTACCIMYTQALYPSVGIHTCCMCISCRQDRASCLPLRGVSLRSKRALYYVRYSPGTKEVNHYYCYCYHVFRGYKGYRKGGKCSLFRCGFLIRRSSGSVPHSSAVRIKKLESPKDATK